MESKSKQAPEDLKRTKVSAAASVRRVLVVDDNHDAAESTAAVLELLGNSARAAHSGADALEIADEFEPDVMLIDIGMPKMNGYELARAVRAKSWGADVMLISLTGWTEEDNPSQAKEAGFDVHLTKPADPDALQKLLAADYVVR